MNSNTQQSPQLTAFLEEIDKFTKSVYQGVYAAKRYVYDNAPAGPAKNNAFNQPAQMDEATLNEYVENLRLFNNILEANPQLANEAKQPNNAKIIKSYYEKIATAITNIQPTPVFERNITSEFQRFNGMMFSNSSFNYPKPSTNVPQEDSRGSIESSAASSLKQKASMAANALRGVIGRVSGGDAPFKHPGWDNPTNDPNDPASYDKDGNFIPGYEQWRNGYRDPKTGKWVPGQK